ncbi:MAG: membrane protein insertase YidC [Myxococcales bacterium]|nr:MAG: membrane protein insertase YidC [Myxococcales bacterium]
MIRSTFFAPLIFVLSMLFGTTAAAQSAAKEQPSIEAQNPSPALRISAPSYEAELDRDTSALKHFSLRDERYKKDGKAIDIITTDKPSYLPLRFELKGVEWPEKPAWQVKQLSDRSVRFQYEQDHILVARKIEAGKSPYQLWSTLRVSNFSQEEKTISLRLGSYHYIPRKDESGGFIASRSPNLSHAVCSVNGKVEREDRKELLKKHSYKGKVRFVATENVYFVNALAPTDPDARHCDLVSSDRGGTKDKPHGSLFEAYLDYPKHKLAPGETVIYRTMAYLGPKTPEALRAAGHGMPKVIDLGFFSQLAGYLTRLLSSIHSVVPNWGFAIILLTLFVKLLLFPLTAKSFKSMARMRLLKPELDKLTELYKDDKEKRGAATMELYRKQKINPLGGCLPQLLQLPVWWALYTSLSTNVQLYHANFALWWQDLSAPDPFFVLPVALGALMYFQQKLTPSAMDPAQAKMMMYMMPLMMMGFMLFLPSGLCLYILTNSVLSIAQQKYFEHAALAEAPSEAGSQNKPLHEADKDSDQVKKAKPNNRRSRRGRTKTART